MTAPCPTCGAPAEVTRMPVFQDADGSIGGACDEYRYAVPPAALTDEAIERIVNEYCRLTTDNKLSSVEAMRAAIDAAVRGDGK